MTIPLVGTPADATLTVAVSLENEDGAARVPRRCAERAGGGLPHRSLERGEGLPRKLGGGRPNLPERVGTALQSGQRDLGG